MAEQRRRAHQQHVGGAEKRGAVLVAPLATAAGVVHLAPLPWPFSKPHGRHPYLCERSCARNSPTATRTHLAPPPLACSEIDIVMLVFSQPQLVCTHVSRFPAMHRRRHGAVRERRHTRGQATLRHAGGVAPSSNAPTCETAMGATPRGQAPSGAAAIPLLATSESKVTGPRRRCRAPPPQLMC